MSAVARASSCVAHRQIGRHPLKLGLPAARPRRSLAFSVRSHLRDPQPLVLLSELCGQLLSALVLLQRMGRASFSQASPSVSTKTPIGVVHVRMQQHNMTMTTPSDPSKDASSTFRPLIRLFRILKESVGRLSAYAKKPARGMLVTAKKFLRNLRQAIRHPAHGIFPLIGIFSILVLTVLTVGVPTWATTRQLWPLEVFVILAIILGGYLSAIDRQKYRASFARVFGWLPVTLGAASYGYWYWYASGEGIPGARFLPCCGRGSPSDPSRRGRRHSTSGDLQSQQLVLPIVAVLSG